MNFIKTMSQGKHDEDVQQQMKRFSKGNFTNKALIEINNGKNIKIKTSFEFANWFVRNLAEKGNGEYDVEGGIISTKDLRTELGIEVEDMKQFMGVKTFMIRTKLKKEKILELLNKFPDAMVLLSFENDYGKIKIKVKAPTSGKSKNDDEEVPRADYCTFITDDNKVLEEFAFDFPKDFKEAKIRHTFAIDNIEIPNEYKNNPPIARMKAIRHGKLIRNINIDGKEIVKEYKF